jgi:hypothetical protein
MDCLLDPDSLYFNNINEFFKDGFNIRVTTKPKDLCGQWFVVEASPKNSSRTYTMLDYDELGAKLGGSYNAYRPFRAPLRSYRIKAYSTISEGMLEIKTELAQARLEGHFAEYKM